MTQKKTRQSLSQITNKTNPLPNNITKTVTRSQQKKDQHALPQFNDNEPFTKNAEKTNPE